MGRDGSSMLERDMVTSGSVEERSEGSGLMVGFAREGVSLSRDKEWVKTGEYTSESLARARRARRGVMDGQKDSGDAEFSMRHDFGKAGDMPRATLTNDARTMTLQYKRDLRKMADSGVL